jgi:RNA polymerase sigma-B factor
VGDITPLACLMSVAPSWPNPLPALPAVPTPQLRLVHSVPAADEPGPAEPTDAELFARLRADGPDAHRCRERLVERYTWLATSSARRYSARGENDEDLRQIACVGLLEAITRFDHTRGIDFEFFARPTILGHLRRHFRDGRRWVRIPRRLQELATEVKDAREVLAERNRRTPTLRELAEHVGAAEAEVAEALTAEQFFAPASLDAPVGLDADAGATRGDLLGAPDARLDLIVGWTALRPLIDALPDREREIVIATFWRDETQASVGQRLGISQMQVSRVLARTLRDLRAALDAD